MITGTGKNFNRNENNYVLWFYVSILVGSRGHEFTTSKPCRQTKSRVLTTRLWCVVAELRTECLFALFVKVVSGFNCVRHCYITVNEYLQYETEF